MSGDSFRGFALTRQLDPHELDLLDTIWGAAFDYDFANGAALGWQTWDFIWRNLVREKPDSPNPELTLANLPTVVVPGSGRRYGLVWEADPESGGPAARRIGLCIAGLLRPIERKPSAAGFADGTVQLVASIARAEVELLPERDGVASTRRPLNTFSPVLDALTRATVDARYAMTPLAVGQMLQREYIPLSINPAEDGGVVNLGWVSSREFATVQTAHEYLERIAEDTAQARQAALLAPSPLTLVQTIDYLSLVLETHPAWGRNLHLVSAPDLQSAAVLGAHVESQQDFEAFVNAFWNIVNQFSVPKVPAIELDPGRPAPKTLDRLAYWLESNVSDPLPDAVIVALGQIRDVGRIRDGFAHSAHGTRATAVDAASRIGLPSPIVGGVAAWETVQQRLAAAFNTIRIAVQNR
jgi:hypothetical protein